VSAQGRFTQRVADLLTADKQVGHTSKSCRNTRCKKCFAHSTLWEGRALSKQVDAAGIYQAELLTVKEVADYLRVSRVTVWRWCQKGIIPAIRVGHLWRVRCSDLWDYQDSSRRRETEANSLASEAMR